MLRQFLPQARQPGITTRCRLTQLWRASR